MVFTNKTTSTDLKLNIDGNEIDKIEHTKFLGVIIDNKLNWKKHISCISGKVSRGIGIMIKARKYLPKDALLSLYYSFIYPYLTYCNIVWGTACVSNLEKLQMLQKKVVRIIAGVKPRDHTDPLFREYGLLKFSEINTFLTGRFMFKVFNQNIIDIFQELFERNSDIHSYATRQASDYHLPLVNTNLGKRGIRYHGVNIWNTFMQKGIITDCSEAVFKNVIKKALMENSFSQ